MVSSSKGKPAFGLKSCITALPWLQQERAWSCRLTVIMESRQILRLPSPLQQRGWVNTKHHVLPECPAWVVGTSWPCTIGSSLARSEPFQQLPVIFPYYRYNRDILSLSCQREGPAGPFSSGASGFEKQLHPPWPWLVGALWQSGGWAGRERMALVDEPAWSELWETLLNAAEWTNVPQRSCRS